jgi:hypothetical protein
MPEENGVVVGRMADGDVGEEIGLLIENRAADEQ